MSSISVLEGGSPGISKYSSIKHKSDQYLHMGQRHGCYLNKVNIVLVFLSVKSSGEFMAHWLMWEDDELELTKNSINCVVRMTL